MKTCLSRILTIAVFSLHSGLFLPAILAQNTTTSAILITSYGHIAGAWKVSFDKAEPLRVVSKKLHQIKLSIYDVDTSQSDYNFFFELVVNQPHIAYAYKRVPKSEFIANGNDSEKLASWQGTLPLYAQNFGYARLYVILRAENGALELSEQAAIDLEVKRAQRLDEKIYRYTASFVVLLMFLNLGTVLDLQRLKQICLRPIGPIVALICRYVLLPPIGLALGYFIFPKDKSMQLALFFSALSPSGGIANICSVFCKGNIDLSIAATTTNSLLALAMMPLWIFLLARVVYDNNSLTVPFLELGVGVIAVILVITLGICMRAFAPKTTALITRFLKPLSIGLSLCLVALTVGINYFTFRELTLMVVLASILLPLIAYILTYGLALLVRMSDTDAMTVAIETSVLNMTVPILLLQTSMEPTRADLLIVLPIMCGIMSLLIVWLFYILRITRYEKKSYDLNNFNDKAILVLE